MNFSFWTKQPGESPDTVPFINLLSSTATTNTVDARVLVETAALKSDSIESKTLGGTIIAASSIDMKGNDLTNTGSINGQPVEDYLVSPLTEALDCGGQNLTNIATANIATLQSGSMASLSITSNVVMPFKSLNCSEVTTQSLTSEGMLPIQASDVVSLQSVNEEIKMLSQVNFFGNGFYGVDTGSALTIATRNLQCDIVAPINVLSTLDLQGFQNIQGVNVISAGESVTETTNTNNILSDLGMINIRGDFKGDGKASIQELTTLQSNSLTVTNIYKNAIAENIRVNNELNMLGNNVVGVGDLSVSTLNGKTPVYNPAITDLDMKSYNIGNAGRLNVTTLQSNATGVAPIIIEDTLRTQSLIPDTMGFRNIGSATDPYDNITANTVSSTALSAPTGYTQVIVNNDLNLDNTHKVKGVGTVESKNIDAVVNGGTLNVLCNLDLKTTKNIVGVGTLSSTTINNSLNLTTGGIFRAGTILQDTSLSCYAQYTQTVSTSLSVPLTPTNLVLVFNTSLTPLNVTTSSPTFNAFTILHDGVYRCVFSLNGEMSADREMTINFRKNNSIIRSIYLSRTGTRNVETSFNELLDCVATDALSISVLATDAAFTFTLRSATFNIEKLRRNVI